MYIMRFKVFINIIFGTMICLAANAQDNVFEPRIPYEPITFEGVTPVYHTVLHDNEYRKFGSDGYNCFSRPKYIKNLRHKNYYISIYVNKRDGETIYDNQFYGNYYITCINLDNGKLVWQNKVFLSSYPNPEIPRLMEVDDDGVLHIYGQIREDLDDFLQYYSDLIFFERQYDLETGELLSFYHKAFDDPEAFHTFYAPSVTSLFFKQDDGDFRMVERFDTSDGDVGFKNYSLDRQGRLTSGPDTVLYQHFHEFVPSTNIKNVGRDSLLLLEIDFDDEGNEVIILRYFNYNFNPLDEVVIKSPFVDYLPSLYFSDISPDKDKMMLTVWTGDLDDYRHHVVITKNGQILKQTKQNDIIAETYNWWSDDNLFFTTRSKYLAYHSDELSGKNEIQFKTEHGEFQDSVEKVIVVEDPFRVGTVADMIRYNDKEIVLMVETALYYSDSSNRYYVDDVAFAWSFIAFNKGDFFPSDAPIVTGTSQPDKKKISAIKAYPNPSAGLLMLGLQDIEGFADIRIFDMAGRNVFVHSNVSAGEVTLDLSSLQDGTYVYKVYQGNKELGSGQWVKVR